MTANITIVLAILSWTAHNMFLKILGDKIPSAIATPANYLFAIILLLGIFFFNTSKIDWAGTFTPYIIFITALAGFTIALTDYFFLKTLNAGMEISSLAPIFVGAGVAFIATLGIILFKEEVSFLKIFGIILTIIGVLLINYNKK